MFENEDFTTVSEEVDDIMPDGWHDEGDFFDEASWGAADTQADESGVDGGPAAEEEAAADDESAPTTEQEAAPGDAGGTETEAPTTEPVAEVAPHKLKFKARVDRQDLDVELDESDLPTIYQKAQATDRAQAKQAKLDQRAKTLGFDGLESMLESVEKNYRANEVNRLVGEGVHEEVAEYVVASHFPAQAPAAPETHASTKAEPGEAGSVSKRDYFAETNQLLTVYPELRGKQLPKEVIQACLDEKQNLLVAYHAYEIKQERAAAEKIRKENEILKQNAASAAKAPVSGTKGGGSTDTKPEDDFLRGFNDDY